MTDSNKLMHDAAIWAWIIEEEKKRKRKKVSIYVDYPEEDDHQSQFYPWKRKPFLDRYNYRE